MCSLTGVSVASLSLRGVGPHTCAGVLVEMQTLRALDLNRLALDAIVEDVADRGVGMRKEAVLARTETRALGFLCGMEEENGYEKTKSFDAFFPRDLRNSTRSSQSTLNGWSHLFFSRIVSSNTRPSGQMRSCDNPSMHS